MIIRVGTHNDIDAASRLWLMMAEELSPRTKPNVQWWKDQVSGMIGGSSYFMVVAEGYSGLIGFGDSLVFPEPMTGKMHWLGRHIYVVPRMRNAGVAARIYRRGVEIAKERGATVFNVICAVNELAMWSKKGYEIDEFMLKRE